MTCDIMLRFPEMAEKSRYMAKNSTKKSPSGVDELDFDVGCALFSLR